ncbi:2-oxoisovalerate dehydrogenase subunit alpha 1, mitochondrial [Linum perenne]
MGIWVARKSGAAMAAAAGYHLRRTVVNSSSCCSSLIEKKNIGNPSVGALWRRFKSTRSAAVDHADSSDEDSNGNAQVLDFLGGQVTYVPEMKFILESNHKRVPCYRVLDDNGGIIPGSEFEEVSQGVAVKMYTEMVKLQVMDTIFYEAQRQGRLSFYLTSSGEEAISVASAAALTSDDVILPQYREPGILLWRGFTLQEFANQLFGNKDDYGKGRQMPIHYGSKKLNYITISSPLATQIPQAAGVAYSLKMDKKDACVATFFGDGSTSEGDFHAGLNFAAVTESPVIFVCRNNGWAISTNVSEQFRSDGIVVKGQGYGIRSIRVDGNDALAVYSAIHTARHIAVTEGKPVLVEFLTYRVGHHSTSDDSTKYRPLDEIEYWKVARNPVNRFRKWVEANGWWTIQSAERTEKPPLEEMFADVYDQPPLNLCQQEEQLREAVKRYPADYPSDVPV